MKSNTCNYSDEWQPYIKDYDKYEYDIKLKDGTIVENCYPNAGEFNSVSDEHNDKSFKEEDVIEIRFSQRPRFMLNHKVSNAKPDKEYVAREAQRMEQHQTYKRSLDNFLDSNEYLTLKNMHLEKEYFQKSVPIRTEPKIGRNDVCPKCDSGKKYKKCCLN